MASFADFQFAPILGGWVRESPKLFELLGILGKPQTFPIKLLTATNFDNEWKTLKIALL